MPWKKYNPCAPCCCETIGFEQHSNQGILKCCKPEFPALTDLYQAISRLEECAAVFAGAQNQCQYSTQFDPSDWPTIKTWIEDGGRMYVAGEYIGCITQQVRDDLNDFVAALGSSMRLGSVQCECGCNDAWTGNLNTSVPLLDGVEAIHHACTNSVSGGTWLAKTNFDSTNPSCSEIVYIAIEQLGDGYLILAGDSNIVEGCSYENCKLWKNFIRKKTLL